MTDSPSTKNNMAMLHNPKHITRLKLSIETKTYDGKPMTPIEVAFAIKEFTDEADSTIKDIVRRLKVHADIRGLS